MLWQVLHLNTSNHEALCAFVLKYSATYLFHLDIPELKSVIVFFHVSIHDIHKYILSSMITVVEFRTKQATGSRYMPTDKFYNNYFFIKIDLDWLELVKNWARFQKKECFKNENNQIVLLIKVLLLIWYSSMKKKLDKLDKFGWFLT